MKYLRIVNWDKLQHYKDRNPPWIKLYSNLLDNYTFCLLPDETKAHLLCLWVLASRLANKLPDNARWLTSKIGAKKTIDLQRLKDDGYLAKWESDEENDWPNRYVPEELRRKIFDKHDGKCATCGSAEYPELDHIKPISKGGKSEEANLQLLCRNCNRKKHNSLSDKCYGKRSNLPQSNENDAIPETETETEKIRR